MHSPVPSSDKVLAYHTCKTQLVLGHRHGRLITEVAFTKALCTSWNKLCCGRAYTISGPFGQDPVTKQASIKHTPMSQVDIGPWVYPHSHLAGKARLSGIGKIKSVIFEEGSRPGMPWNAVIVVTHDFSDPLTPQHPPIPFDMIYHFGHYTPLPYYWSDLAPGATIWIDASLFAKDAKTSSFIAQIENYQYLSTSNTPA
ncbi:uncharacterized protein MELLADRAFT_61561 [Melampsora larici-populina 98AG31]|uniref:Uncharacterized protein n=1 Tax=Melampsora larici-populina (strain 98AG31 / pathotype 3-4-7) TaxID=747676 RepID=F4RFE8_MELLP|nr:uncharacterized protein MELLADRAFT_61561 [Melampsora larici-populina 98AG31]EGG08797.1 hypothetical protein MELLADRAFT_61561 [Melampsora larici-populina 98AG31]